MTGAGGHQIPSVAKEGVGKRRGRPGLAQSWAGGECGSRAPALPEGKGTRQSWEPWWEWKSPRELPARATLSPAAILKDSLSPCPVQRVPGAPASPAPQRNGIQVVFRASQGTPAWAAPRTRRGQCPLSPPGPSRNLGTSAQPCPGLGIPRDAMGEMLGRKTPQLG